MGFRLLCSCVVAVLLNGAAAFAADVIWIGPRDMAEGAVKVANAGAYAVWAWTPTEEQTRVRISAQALSGGAMAGETDVWRKLGEVELAEGDAPVEASDHIHALVLASSSDFDPEKAVAATRVNVDPVTEHDARLTRPRHTDTVFTMPHFESLDAWEQTAGQIRRRMRIATGLWPMPEKTPLNPRVEPAGEFEGVTVETVAFEAWPGFYVTGNLYRPPRQGRFPGILSPHGHWENGRLEDGERGSVPKRCMTLAKLGAVVLSIDMLGYNDSLQFEHRWASKADKLWGIHPFALQLWSSIRAVDFLQSLPYVDNNRIACTGASGGGTQTFALTAVDDRVKVSAPVNMISSTMQGGCICENAPLIRIGNSNMEIGALMAPRPMLLVSATGDWTRETPRVEYPAIRSIYALYGREDAVANAHFDAQHNYNRASREAMYRFFGEHVYRQDDVADGYTEPGLEAPAPEDLRVFPSGEPPEDARTPDQIKADLRERAAARWDAELPNGSDALQAFHEEHGALFSDVLGVTPVEPNDLRQERVRRTERDGYVVEGWLLARHKADESVPAIFYHASSADPQDTVLVVHGRGKQALADPASGEAGPLIRGLLDAGKAVVAIDPFLIGEHQFTQGDASDVYSHEFSDTFRPTITGQRVQDILTAAAFIRARRDLTGEVDVVGLDRAGVWCLFAAAVDNAIRKVVADAHHFDTSDDTAWAEEYYVPSIRAVGGAGAAGALVAPRPLWIMNTGEAFDVAPIRASYADAPSGLFRHTAEAVSTPEIVAALW